MMPEMREHKNEKAGDSVFLLKNALILFGWIICTTQTIQFAICSAAKAKQVSQLTFSLSLPTEKKKKEKSFALTFRKSTSVRTSEPSVSVNSRRM